MSMDQSSLRALATTISQATAEISKFLSTEGFSELSFTGETPPFLILPPHLQRLRAELLRASSELHILALGPLGYLLNLTSPSHNVLASLHFINRYQIASKIKLGEEVSFEEIADHCDVHVDDARRILRLAIAFHVFEEKSSGLVSHSAVSRCMLDMPFVNDWIGHFCDEIWPSAPKTVEALSKWPCSQEPNETAFSLTANSGQSLFKFFQETPVKAKRFTNAMKFLQSAPEFSVSHLLNDLHWKQESVPERLVDIGGADGSITAAILHEFPTIKAVVQDLPNVIAMSRVPPDLAGRLEFMGHDMFCPQPIKDADVYFLRSTLHDWSDKHCIAIVRNLIPALKNGASIIINDVCMPPSNGLCPSQAQLLRGYDITMKQLFNSKERDEQEWRSLLTSADHRFHLRRITCSPGSLLAVIEVTWTGSRE